MYQRNDSPIAEGSLLERGRTHQVYKVTKLWDEYKLHVTPQSLNGPGPVEYAELYQPDVAVKLDGNTYFTHIEEI